MIKKSGNLTEWKHISVYNLKSYVLNYRLLLFCSKLTNLSFGTIFNMVIPKTNSLSHKLSIVPTFMQKNPTRYDWFLQEILMVKKSCNVTGEEHFGPQLVNQNFPRHPVCTRKWRIKNTFILDMTKFSKNF